MKWWCTRNQVSPTERLHLSQQELRLLVLLMTLMLLCLLPDKGTPMLTQQHTTLEFQHQSGLERLMNRYSQGGHNQTMQLQRVILLLNLRDKIGLCNEVSTPIPWQEPLKRRPSLRSIVFQEHLCILKKETPRDSVAQMNLAMKCGSQVSALYHTFFKQARQRLPDKPR